MLRDDHHRLRHMLEAGKEAVSFSADRAREDLDTDRKLALSLLKCIEIIGEAAANVSTSGRASFPQVPWSDAIRMRNRLIHAYFTIDLDIVWRTVTQDLPPLVAVLEQILVDNPLPTKE